MKSAKLTLEANIEYSIDDVIGDSLESIGKIDLRDVLSLDNLTGDLSKTIAGHSFIKQVFISKISLTDEE